VKKEGRREREKKRGEEAERRERKAVPHPVGAVPLLPVREAIFCIVHSGMMMKAGCISLF